NGNTVSVTWTETPHGGATIAQRAVYYSPDGGQSWRLVTTNAGASPYAWNVSGLLNGTAYRVRVDVSDNGNPALHGHDGSDADFTIARPGGDNRGPVVVAGALRSEPSPMDNRAATDLLARTAARPGRSLLHNTVHTPGPGPATVLRAGLPRAGPVELAIYGLRGERVRTLVSELQAAGRRSVVWNRRDDSGRLVPSGLYFYRLEAGGDRATRKVVAFD